MARLTVLFVFAVSAVFAQNAAAPAFEVAVIKPSPVVSGQSGMMMGVRIDNAQVSISTLSLSTVLAMAFHVQPYLISGPGWLTTTAFNITAKLPAGTRVDQIPEMLQALFAERFKMAAHWEDREQPVYVLAVAKGGLRVKEKASADVQEATPSGSGTVLTPMGEMTISQGPKGGGISGAGVRIMVTPDHHVHFEFSRFARLVEFLSSDVGRPVLDETNLKGNYDIAYEISPEMQIREGAVPGPGDENPTFVALRGLGLTVESRKAPVETIVIDHLEKNPTEN